MQGSEDSKDTNKLNDYRQEALEKVQKLLSDPLVPDFIKDEIVIRNLSLASFVRSA